MTSPSVHRRNTHQTLATINQHLYCKKQSHEDRHPANTSGSGRTQRYPKWQNSHTTRAPTTSGLETSATQPTPTLTRNAGVAAKPSPTSAEHTQKPNGPPATSSPEKQTANWPLNAATATTATAPPSAISVVTTNLKPGSNGDPLPPPHF